MPYPQIWRNPLPYVIVANSVLLLVGNRHILWEEVKNIMHIPVLVFETNKQNLKLFGTALRLRHIPHVLNLVQLRRDTAPPVEKYFLRALEQHRPTLLITSWRHIGPVVRRAEQTMVGSRPLEKWVVSGYSTRELEEQQSGVSSWADMIYEKPISPYFLAAEIERRLAFLSPTSSSNIIVPT